MPLRHSIDDALERRTRVDLRHTRSVHDHPIDDAAEDTPAFRPVFDTLVVDVDHTLIDWTRGWARAVRHLLAHLDRRGHARAEWIAGLRASYARHQLMDADSALDDAAASMPGRGWLSVMRGAALEYRGAARASTREMRGVRRTLSAIKHAGARVIAYTESPPGPTSARLEQSGLAPLVDLVICTRRDGPMTRDRRLSLSMTTHRAGRVVAVPDWHKGAPASVRALLENLRVTPERALFAGDRLDKDVLPASALGVRAVWAKYGMRRSPADYALLESLCFWPAETESAAPSSRPPARAITCFDEILSLGAWTRASWRD